MKNTVDEQAVSEGSGSILALALTLTSLSRAKAQNATLHEVMIWQNLANFLAIRAKRRILHFAMIELGVRQ